MVHAMQLLLLDVAPLCKVIKRERITSNLSSQAGLTLLIILVVFFLQ